jgi:molecular chaperone DnaK
VPADLKGEVESKIAACRSAMEGQDTANIQSTVQELSEAVQKIGASMYQQPGESPTEDDAGPPPSDEDVVEGEFSEA